MGDDSKSSGTVFDNWSKRMDGFAKGAPDDFHFDEELDEIISQLERGEYSSLDPELRREIEERERGEKSKKIAKSAQEESTI